MTKFFFKSKKTLFFAHFLNFWGRSFSNKSYCQAQLHKGFWHHAKMQRNLMIQFHEHTQTDV